MRARGTRAPRPRRRRAWSSPGDPTYDERGHYLTVRDGELGVRFETDGSRVDAIHVGDYFAIQAVEGCA